MKNYSTINLSTIEFAWRVFTAFYMFRYGMVKLTGEQFAYGKDLYDKTINELSGLDLTWVFFSYSESFANIIALFQICGGLLLLFNKTKLLAVTLLFPILLNILLIDILYAGYPILEAIINVSFYILVLVFICYNERIQISKAFAALILSPKNPLSLKAKTFQIFVVILTIILTYIIINFIIKKFLLGIHFQSEIFH
ncbi:hypothetical protein [Aequorivita lipolytica]|uniref:DoxX family membrane protein n=1 Tax=Aequorivita lipolytica TaxID=153267 RepID=A0A5C6YNK7_9FLAO|nr:hypothetical protein [Aequorivita lipolytica]TXD68898.1 hypothetical protein ESV24_10625 [Aequorivita lipolytica]SRX52158.1 hypothetical protein AEQU2_02137 [Aequorivita lipolytica]